MTLYWADVLTIVPILGRFLFVVGKSRMSQILRKATFARAAPFVPFLLLTLLSLALHQC